MTDHSIDQRNQPHRPRYAEALDKRLAAENELQAPT